MKEMILIHSALSDDMRTVVISVESELTNMDVKSMSARSLPCPHTLRKSSHLLSPKVLQIAWVRVTKSSVEDFVRNSSSWRLDVAAGQSLYIFCSTLAQRSALFCVRFVFDTAL
ncbi:uncharacterized protein LOC126593974 [Malus sylvestris]|uniref:uncharacterized protein LOC126593974 n=1 Tax=Malus sylvestris TaxID=3752 RepID=UPI0021AC7ED6|nr:uncharacterized protein LOC126593974 [Malus sylvestris]